VLPGSGLADLAREVVADQHLAGAVPGRAGREEPIPIEEAGARRQLERQLQGPGSRGDLQVQVQAGALLAAGNAAVVAVDLGAGRFDREGLRTQLGSGGPVDWADVASLADPRGSFRGQGLHGEVEGCATPPPAPGLPAPIRLR
jgi:hypothetical protein